MNGATAAVVSDFRYGHVVDNDSSLVSAGLISHLGYSMLCGPVAFENVLIKFRSELNLPAADALSEIKNLIALHPAVVQNGILRDDYQKTIEQYAQTALRVSPQVNIHVIGASNFDVNQLKQATLDKQAVILQIWWWEKSAFRSINPWSVPAENGHWVTVIGYDDSIAGRFLIQDPMHPDPLWIDLSSAFPAKTIDGARTYLNETVNYEGSPPYLNPGSHTALVGDYLTLQLP